MKKKVIAGSLALLAVTAMYGLSRNLVGISK